MHNPTQETQSEQPPDAPLGAKLDPATLTLRIDQQEKNPICSAPMQAEYCHLTVGDYALRGIPETLAAAERKSESDLLMCLGVDRDRFMRQVQRLLGCRHKVLVVESTPERLAAGQWRSKITPQSVEGQLAALTLDGLPIMLVGDHDGAARYITRWFYLLANRRLQESRELLGEIRHRRKEAVQ